MTENEFKKELIDYGISQLPKYKPKDLNLYKEQQITKLLDKYGDKWCALSALLYAKGKEILQRPELTEIDDTILQMEFDSAVIAVRNKFTSIYPLNL